jgi:hypothetical protein
MMQVDCYAEVIKLMDESAKLDLTAAAKHPFTLPSLAESLTIKYNFPLSDSPSKSL